MSARARPLADLLRLFVGPGVWFAHFIVVYGTEAVVCRAPGASAGRIVVSIGAAATLAALAALAVFAVMQRQKRPAHAAADHTGAGFLHRAALLLALLSAIAVVWVGLPITALPACSAPAG